MANFYIQNIVLADDDEDDRSFFEEAIKEIDKNLNVTILGDGEQLINYLRAQDKSPDIIFLDLNMPKKNGLDTLKEIRNMQEFKSTPVIICTTSLSKKDINDTFNHGAHYYFKKPNSFGELKRILSSVLQSGFKNYVPLRETFLLQSDLTTY